MLKLISLSNNYRFVACLLWLAATPLLAEEIKCPDHVSIVKQAIVSPVEGWHLSSRFDSLLNDGELFLPVHRKNGLISKVKIR